VFFRLDSEPLNLECIPSGLTEKEREEREITEDEIKEKETLTHRFWHKNDETSGEKAEKRKRDATEDTDSTDDVKKRVRSDHETYARYEQSLQPQATITD
jgi:hypothetical protein